MCILVFGLISDCQTVGSHRFLRPDQLPRSPDVTFSVLAHGDYPERNKVSTSLLSFRFMSPHPPAIFIRGCPSPTVLASPHASRDLDPPHTSKSPSHLPNPLVSSPNTTSHPHLALHPPLQLIRFLVLMPCISSTHSRPAYLTYHTLTPSSQPMMILCWHQSYPPEDFPDATHIYTPWASLIYVYPAFAIYDERFVIHARVLTTERP